MRSLTLLLESTLKRAIPRFGSVVPIGLRSRVPAGWVPVIRLAAFLGAVALAIRAQLLLDASPASAPNLWSLALYGAAGLLFLGALVGDRGWLPAAAPRQEVGRTSRASLHRGWLLASLLAAGVTFLGMGGNRFRLWAVAAWLFCLGGWFLAWSGGWPSLRARLTPKGVRLQPHHLLLVAIFLIGTFFRYWALPDLPHEVNSDHAEKLLDVRDVLRGQFSIFFPRNTGREAMQFYIAAAMVRFLGLPLHALTLQIGTAFIGLLLLPGLYLLGRELWGRTGAIWLTFLGALSSWAVIPARVGLRYPFLPTFAALTFAFLLRGIRHGRRADFLLMGLFLGLGMYGYSPFRGMAAAVPAVFLTAWLLKGSWRTGAGWRQVGDFLLGVVTSLLVFLPVLRFMIDFPGVFSQRVFTRVTSAEREIAGSPLALLAENLRRALLFFHWTGDEVYVATLPEQPVLDPFSGALLILGIVALLWWTVSRRDVVPLALFLGGLVMLLPSALNLAYPRENPSTVRTAGAIPAVLATIALVPALWSHRAVRLGGWRRGVALLPALLLAAALLWVNGQRHFVTYAESYCRRTLNTSEVAGLIQDFQASGGAPENAFFVGYPHWHDARLIGMWLGDLDWSGTVWHADLLAEVPEHQRRPGPKLYLVYPGDKLSLRILRESYPEGAVEVVPRQRCSGNQTVVFRVSRP